MLGIPVPTLDLVYLRSVEISGFAISLESRLANVVFRALCFGLRSGSLDTGLEVSGCVSGL